MQEIFLAVIFMLNGTPTIMDGWEPRQHPSMEVCLQRREYMESYTTEYPDGIPEVGLIYCGTLDQIQQQINILNSELT